MLKLNFQERKRGAKAKSLYSSSSKMFLFCTFYIQAIGFLFEVFYTRDSMPMKMITLIFDLSNYK